jgi:AcrR family transcriptional regulator
VPRTKKVGDSIILKMILEVIAKEGATTFSLEDLSKKTGLSPATLLQRFGSKRNILHKAIELANQDLKNNLTNRSVIDKSPLKEIINVYLELSMPFSNPIDVARGLDILKLDITEKRLNRLTKKYFELRRNKITSLVTLAQKQGEIAFDFHIADLVWNLECLWQGSIMLWALTQKGKLQPWLTNRFSSFLKSLLT